MSPRLKSLELHGYKTFASRYKFEFPADITAIVGPNGSGKSNVADAIRWVLGEQSYSVLRGKKTEDMIFSGSELRPRAGMATASITFDNADGWLPIDYSEVTISRRAYRDGQNEYMLNGNKVRLKEIGELLAQSGLAQRTYTIIGQGLVDAALSISPDERRKFFEEAAGIGLYRKRREEALNRLDSTHRNMERVNDILSELVPRLKSLEKQAKRAAEYERVKADLKILLLDWYGYHWHNKQSELSHAREVLTAQEERLEKARVEKNAVDAQVDELRGELADVRNELNIWHNELSGLHQRREKISKDLAVIDERYRMLLEQESQLESELAQYKEDLTLQRNRVETQKSEFESKKSDLNEAKKNLQEAEAQLEQKQAERGEIIREVRKYRQNLVEYEKRKVELNARYEELKNRIQSQEKTLKFLNESISTNQNELKRLKEKQEDKETEKTISEEEFNAVQASLINQREKNKEIEKDQNEIRSLLNQTEAEKIRVSAQLDSITQAEKSFSGLNQGAQFILQSNKKGVLRGQFKSLSANLEVPEEYETAIAAVLGDYLDGIILSPDADLESSLKLLEKGEKGKAILLPLQTIKESQKLNITGDGMIGLALDVVKPGADANTIIKTLLGQVILVHDRAEAQNLLGKIPEHARIVTLNGEIFYGNGTIIAGKDGRSGLIARTRRKGELEKTLETVTRNLSDLSASLEKTRKELESGRSKLANIEKDVDQKRKNMNAAQQAFNQLVMEIKQQEQKINFDQNRINELQKELEDTNQQVKTNFTKQKETDANILELDKVIRESNRKINEYVIEDIQATVNHWKTNFAVANQAVNSAANLLNTYSAQLDSIKNQQIQTERRFESIQYELANISNNKGDFSGSETDINSQIKELQEKIHPAEIKLESLEKLYNQKQEDQKSFQQNLSVAERYETQAQHDLTRQKESLELLRKRIEDDFGLVSFEYQTDISGPTPLPLEGMVKDLPIVKKIEPEIEESINQQRAQLRRMGSVNPEAQLEYERVEERHGFLSSQLEDLINAERDLRSLINELDGIMKEEFQATFNAVAAEFKVMFTRLFGGGSAQLILVDADNPTETGVDIEATLPGRRKQGLSMLSGGERSLTATALIFSLLKVSPTPFCVMDEVDAALDEANVGRFGDLLKELGENTQFIVITHNRNTVQVSDVIYGVTMGRDSASQVISLKLEEVGGDMVR